MVYTKIQPYRYSIGEIGLLGRKKWTSKVVWAWGNGGTKDSLGRGMTACATSISTTFFQNYHKDSAYLGRVPVFKSLVRVLFIIEPEVITDAGSGFPGILIRFQINLLVLDQSQ